MKNSSSNSLHRLLPTTEIESMLLIMTDEHSMLRWNRSDQSKTCSIRQSGSCANVKKRSTCFKLLLTNAKLFCMKSGKKLLVSKPNVTNYSSNRKKAKNKLEIFSVLLIVWSNTSILKKIKPLKKFNHMRQKLIKSLQKKSNLKMFLNIKECVLRLACQDLHLVHRVNQTYSEPSTCQTNKQALSKLRQLN